jgi:hypothetical protein
VTHRRNLVRQTLLALLGVLALLVQGALTSGAMAAPAFKMVTMCTEHGNRKVAIPVDPADQKHAPCPHCDHCVAPALAVTPQVTTAQPVTYVTSASLISERPATIPYAARAPPRPPSQAPPQS